uniref:At1g61320/AtMIF1 LRR domain-containing protein n=1 Tax=Arundo donax TaxID=35708 RepID=A0A0A9BZZ8_ARUDO
MLNKLVIKVGSFKPKDNGSKITFSDLVRANATLNEAIKSILARRNASQYAIQLLCLQFYLGDESISIGRTVGGTMEIQTVGSAEFAILTKKGRAQCTEDDVLFHGRQLMLFIDACPNTFGGLTCLRLENVRLDESGFPSIFSTCKRLEFLRLNNCDKGMLSFLEVEHPRLGELEMDHCHFEWVHLKWLPKLSTLTFTTWITQQDPLYFGYVPLLQSVSLTNIGLSWHKMLKLSEFLGDATISNLQLNFKSEKIWVQPEGPKLLLPVFQKLRLVNLINISEECDLNWTMFILEGAPSLEEFHITVRDHFCEMLRDEELRKRYAYSEEKKGVDWEGSASGFKHHKLLVLKIFGFRPEDKFVNYVRSVMEAAESLDDIFLFNKLVCERCKHKVPKASRSPWPKKQRFSLRNRIMNGTNSFAVIHFPSSSSH